MSFEIAENIFRIVIPFEDIYTTVFLIRTDEGVLLFDTATFPEDMDQYVFPVLENTQIEPQYVFISHNHRDHAGGLERVVERYPQIKVVTMNQALCEKYENAVMPADGDRILSALRVVAIPGHTRDCMALLDTRTNTLLTGDSLQIYGIYGSGNWGANIRFPVEHIAALDKLKAMNVGTIIASHDYHPCGYMAQGEAEVEAYLCGCREALEEICRMIREFPALDDAGLAQRYNETKGLPRIGAHVFEALRRTMA